MRCEIGKELIDLCVVSDVARENERAVEFGGEFGNTVQESLVLIGKSQCRAFTMASLGDAVSNRVFREKTGDQNALACENPID